MGEGTKRAAVLAAVGLVLATACTGGRSDAVPSPTPSRPPAVVLIGRNIALLPGEERALRIGFEPFEPSARVIVSFRPPGARVTVCPLEGVAAAVPGDRARCRRDVGSGVRETVGAAGMRAVAVTVDGEREVSADVTLEYDEAGRDFEIRFPLVRRPSGGVSCEDNACNPFFEVRPTRSGAFSARARWSGSGATLILFQGSVLGRSQTATGVPYREAARADGSSPLSIRTRLSAPGEYALALRHASIGPETTSLQDVEIEGSWP